MSVATFLMVHVFTALLPPTDDDTEDGEFFAVLGLRKSASPEEIRKAYKQKSLALHPDKVAQRRQLNAKEAAAEYERVQEAYACLSDKRHARQYRAVGYSVSRYRFLSNGGVMNPVALYQNLCASSVHDKTRLVLLVTTFCVLFLVQPILLAAKVNAVVRGRGLLYASKWIALLTPTWIFWAFYTVIRAIFVDWNLKLYGLAEDACWLAGMVLVALNWDTVARGDVARDWNVVAVPFYLALFFRILFLGRAAANVAVEQAKMVSPEYMETEVLKDKKLEDLTDEEQELLAESYLVVTTDEEAVVGAAAALAVDGHEMTDEDMEALRVRSSPEFQQADKAVSSMGRTACNCTAFGFVFVALVATKAAGQIRVNWWTVFTPVWVYLGLKMVKALFTCCCVSVGHEVVVVPQEDADPDSAADNAVERGEEEMARAGEEEDGAAAAAAGSPSAKSNKSSSSPAAGARKANGKSSESGEGGGGGLLDRLRNSVNWAPAEGPMGDFNRGSSSGARQASSSGAASVSSEDILKSGLDDVVIGDLPSTVPEEDDDVPSDEEQQEGKNGTRTVSSHHHQDDKRLSSPQRTTRKSSGTDPPGGGLQSERQQGGEATEERDEEMGAIADDDGDDDPDVKIDEETFRAWQSAQEEADHSAMEAQAKAQSSCCWTLFQLMTVCLIVGKLEHDYQKPTGEAGGFNAFWILFPVFLIVGILLCCCSCLIYGSAGANLADLMDPSHAAAAGQHEGEGEEKDDAGGERDDDEPPVVTSSATDTTAPALSPTSAADTIPLSAVSSEITDAGSSTIGSTAANDGGKGGDAPTVTSVASDMNELD